MVVIKDLVEEYNLDLNLSEKALNLKFKGDYIYKGIETFFKIAESEFDITVEISGFVFVKDKNKLVFTPDDPDYIIRLYFNVPFFREPSMIIKGVGMYNSEGELTFTEPNLEEWMYSKL